MFYSHCSPKTANRFASDFFQNFFPEENLSKYFGGTMPATNISETETGFLIELATPGLQKEDFEIQIEQSLLTVKVEKTPSPAPEAEATEAKTHYKRKEFDFTNFKRSFRLGKTVDTERIEARYEQGILQIHLPKKEQAQEKLSRIVNIA